MSHRSLALFASLLLVSACVTSRQHDVTGTGDDRLDESSTEAAPQKKAAADETCGAEGKGNVVLYDARTAEVVSCALVSINRENAECVQRCRMLAGEEAQATTTGGTQCPDGTTCPSERVFNGRSNKGGMLNVPNLGSTLLTAVAEGYAVTQFEPKASRASGPVEVELLPAKGFIVKLLDQDGNYLNGVSATFKQGQDVLAQLRSNELANVYLQPNPFGSEPVTVEVEGFAPAEVKTVADLGADGHTLTLSKR